MKKLLSGFLAIGILTFVGCEKEQDNNNNDSNTENNTSGGVCEDSVFTWNDVTSPTGKVWMDRNLGARQVATSSTDADSYGDLYQWGRGKDGHQCRNSNTTSIISSTDTPEHSDFIYSSYDLKFDWRSPQNDSLWQGENGINNPCPSGYRLPSDDEWQAEIATWTSDDASGAYGSVLKLPMAGFRNDCFGSLSHVGTFGYYWSSTVSGPNANYLSFSSSIAGMRTHHRAGGFSVRCIKD